MDGTGEARSATTGLSIRKLRPSYTRVGAFNQEPRLVKVFRLGLDNDPAVVAECHFRVVLHPREVDARIVTETQEGETLSAVVVEDGDTVYAAREYIRACFHVFGVRPCEVRDSELTVRPPGAFVFHGGGDTFP